VFTLLSFHFGMIYGDVENKEEEHHSAALIYSISFWSNA
jgi:hypothetical protein